MVMQMTTSNEKKRYESTITVKFESENWKQASKGNQNLLDYIINMLDMFNAEIDCISLKEIKGDVE